MKISFWFAKHGKRPLLFYGILCLLSQSLFSFYLILNNRTIIANRIRSQVRNVISIGISQNNREVVESAMATIVEELEAEVILLCDNQKLFLQFPPNGHPGMSCAKTTDTIATLTELIPGFNYSMKVKLRNFIIPVDFIGLNVSFLAFLILSFFIFYRFQKKFKEEILEPLTNSIYTDDKLEIDELEYIRTSYMEKQQLAKDKVELETTIKIGQQVSHDIKSPLGALQAACDNLRKNPETSISIVTRAIVRIEKIVADLQNKKNKPNPLTASIDLPLLLEELIEEKRTEYENKKAVISLSCKDHPIRVQGSQSSIERAISNIINNGIESVNNKIPNIQVELAKSNDTCSIFIQDNGSGIPLEDQKKIYDYGFTRGKADGSGTGLAHAKGVIENHYGTLSLSTSNSEGTLFIITLPMA